MVADKSPERLIDAPFFFEFAISCRHCAAPWSDAGVQLDESYSLPSFSHLGQESSSAKPRWADVRMAWSDTGLFFNLRVRDKQRPPWCRATKVEDSDGLAVWIDTRNTQGVHRANRFCHQFRFLPAGGGKKYAAPVAVQLAVDRARENAVGAAASGLKIRAEKRVDGYVLEGHIPGDALTGYDPEEHTQLGFMFAVYDREMGEYTLSVGGEFPYASDPSLWGTLDLAAP
ncbi:MAG: sugar-binding protein [Planctomycetota bacterium]|nr:sugar-binding protein [Planctomycetota bacterium]